jgi:hypothetical protein
VHQVLINDQTLPEKVIPLKQDGSKNTVLIVMG